MSLTEKLNQDLKAAMKARESDRVGTLRLLMADLQKQTLAKSGDLDESEEIDVLARQAKQRRESVEAYEKAGRQDLADKESAELSIIESYLPAQLSEAEVRSMAEEVIREVGATSKKEMGQVMGKLMPKLRGRFPGKDVGPIVQGLLG